MSMNNMQGLKFEESLSKLNNMISSAETSDSEDNFNYLDESPLTRNRTAVPDPLDLVDDSLGPISYPAELQDLPPIPFDELPVELAEIDMADLLSQTGQSQVAVPERKVSRTQDLLTTYKQLGAKGPPTRRGRPMKQTSNSKMAGYARNYRETRKARENISEQIIQQLQEENDQLRLENQRVLESFKRLEAELGQLRSLMDNQGSQQHLQNYHQSHEFVKEVDDFALYY